MQSMLSPLRRTEFFFGVPAVIPAGIHTAHFRYRRFRVGVRTGLFLSDHSSGMSYRELGFPPGAGGASQGVGGCDPPAAP